MSVEARLQFHRMAGGGNSTVVIVVDRAVCVQGQHLESIVHAADEQLVALRGMPLDPPNTAAYLGGREWTKGMSGIEKADVAVVAADGPEVLH